ncbi:MAG TPA: metallophosphoesterase [Clostridia bacterium]|nr:metallophosphoesterase [Clostridia bacterium]
MLYIKKLVNNFIGRVQIPKSIVERKEKVLLHISDTPSTFYRGLEILIRKISPEYIVHTGDVADDIKLGIYPRRIFLYEKKASRLIDILESSDANEIHMAIGNHDSPEILRRLSKRSNIFDAKSVIIENKRFNISHYYNTNFDDSASYHLFGHNLSGKSHFDGSTFHLNGICAIHVIFLDSGEVFELPYPDGVDNSRQGKVRMGT